MQLQASVAASATPDGYLLVLAIILPAVALIALVGLGGRGAKWILSAAFSLQLLLASRIAWQVCESGLPIGYVVGGWSPPLGIALRADGMSALMMLTSALIFAAAAVYAWSEYGPSDRGETRVSLVFWSALLAMASALNTLFSSADLFNLYVALELLTFAAMPVVGLKGTAETLRAALRYLIFAVFGSMLYLLGVVLLYGVYGTLEISSLASLARPDTATRIAAGLVTVGLLAKTALFPFHLWLPPAHAGAPAAGSAILSALVVKGSLFLLMRLWFDTLPILRQQDAMQVLAVLGSAAVVVGSVMALRQARLKLLVAYSTVAQLGYMFFVFALVPASAGETWAAQMAWTGGWVQIVAHAFAKASMFLAAGLVAEALGHDHIERLGGLSARLPLVVLTFALSGLSLMGLPPSGGFNAKFLLLLAAVEEGYWVWVIVIIAGGLLAGAYVFRVLARMLTEATAETPVLAVRRDRQFVALALACVAILMGFIPLEPSAFLQIGRVP